MQAVSVHKCAENEYDKKLIIMLQLFHNMLTLPFKSLGSV